jgi:hypothetical protein
MLAAPDAPRAGTARLTVVALGLVLGLSATAVLPLLLPWQAATTLAAISACLALVPSVSLGLVWYRRGARSVDWLPLGWLGAGVALLSAVALVPLWNVYRGQVRVLNLSDEPFALWVDGRRLARVEPSSGESSRAGAELVLPAGERQLRVVSELDGRELYRASARVSGGSPHLFVPLSAGYCFYVEQRSYGQADELAEADATSASSEALPSDAHFWVLPDGIRLFTPNPEPGPLETSGGTLASLRQRRCGPATAD